VGTTTLRRGAYALLALGVSVLGALAVLYFGSALRLRQWPVVPAVVHVPERGDPVEGARLAEVLGCRSCHGGDLGGDANCYSEPGKMSLVCPNVTQEREHYSDRDLVILLRYGRKRDGALVDFMPWDMYAHLTEQDLGHVLAFVRATPKVAKAQLPPSSYAWTTRWRMLVGDYPVRNDLNEYDSTPLDGPAEQGRYLASVACAECHAPNLRGYPGDDAPSLVVAKAYSAAAFARLMHDGVTINGTESRTGLMSMVARSRLVHLRADEVVALKAYLDQRAP
jgi:mono/diheme cytochrome c family protein